MRIPGCPFLVVKLALPNGMDVSSLMLSKGIGRLCSPKKPSESGSKKIKEKTVDKEEILLDLKYVILLSPVYTSNFYVTSFI